MVVCDQALDEMQKKLKNLFEVKSGYKDELAQSKLMEKHFKYFDTDKSGIIDFDEFVTAMHKLNFIGVQAEMEGLFDRFDEDLNGTISYTEFAKGVFGIGEKMAPSAASRNFTEKVKAKILERGGKNGIRSLTAILRRLDGNGNRCLEKDELYEGLCQYGIRDIDTSEDGELDKVFNYFDRDGSGKITVDELLRGLRGSMAKRRILIVKKAFERLDKTGDGKVTIEDIQDAYDPSQHPEVIAGRLSPNDALLEFMVVFEEGEGDGIIHWHEFLSYYKDLSAGIDNDDEFELMIRNAWHISGGKGFCENSSCRRVLVTHSDGSQEVVEVKDDLGISATDIKKMRVQLEKQGVQDILKISLSE